MKSKKLKNLIKLSSHVRVFVPSTFDVSGAIDNSKQVIEQVIEHCEHLKKEMKQEAISLEVNGELYFI